MARGLAVLHRLGIIHTDLELRKVFVDAKGHAVLGDFGTSLFVKAATSGGVVLFPGVALAPVTAPEVRYVYSELAQEVGADRLGMVASTLVRARVSPRADVWALGCLLLQLLLSSHLPPLSPHDVDQTAAAALELPARERSLKEILAPIYGSPQDGVEGMCAERLARLIARTPALDPALRPSAAELLLPPNPDLPRVGPRTV
jgi:serine/threonine protein kinase